jgi:predicted DNA-binding transcriptional regulator AlpA
MSDKTLLLPRNKCAELLAVSTRTFDRMRSADLIPRPVELRGKTKRWSRAELDAWIAAGCPPRVRWEVMKTKSNKKTM